MKKVDEVVIFRVPNDVHSYHTMFPSQGVAIICDFLLKNSIIPSVYDIVDLLGKQGCRELSDSIRSIGNKENLVLEDYLDVDGKFAGYFNNIISKVNLSRFPIVLISVESVSPISTIVAVLLGKYIKKLNNEILIILGGESVDMMSCSAELFRNRKLNSSIDFIVKINYIENIMTIIRCFESGRSLPEMPSIIYYDRDKDKIVETQGIQEIHRLGKLDFSNFNLAYYSLYMPDYLPGSLVHKDKERMLLLPFSFIYGCPNRCAFCSESVSKTLYYLKPIEVVKVLDELIRKYNTHYFMFLNNTLNINYDYMDELCERIIESGMHITWSDCVHFKNLEKKILLKMKKAGAAKLIFGLETGSNKMLKFCQKGITSQEAKIRLKWSHEAGIWNGIEIIAGLPYEQEEDIKDTINFINSNSGIIDEIHLNRFKLYPCSSFYVNSEQFGICNIKDNGAELLPKLKMARNLLLDDPYFRYSFDEKNGKKWVDKMEQILYSYNRILASSKVRKYPVTSVDLHILLYLYGNFAKKGKIKKFYTSFLVAKRIWNFQDRFVGLVGIFIKRLDPNLYLKLKKIISGAGQDHVAKKT